MTEQCEVCDRITQLHEYGPARVRLCSDCRQALSNPATTVDGVEGAQWKYHWIVEDWRRGRS